MPEAMPELKCAWASHEAAKWACEHWHYSKCLPAGKLFKVGAWEDGRYIGVVIFSRGANSGLGRPYGLEQTECVELTRIALRDHRHFVSEIMACAIKKLHETNPGLRLIVSYADPEHGHIGAIYQATNWIFDGYSHASEEYIVNGKRIHGRSLRSKKPKNMTTKQYARTIDPSFKVITGSSKYRYLMPLDKK